MTTSSIKSPSTKMSATQRHQGPLPWHVSCMTTDVACLFSKALVQVKLDFPVFTWGAKRRVIKSWHKNAPHVFHQCLSCGPGRIPTLGHSKCFVRNVFTSGYRFDLARESNCLS